MAARSEEQRPDTRAPKRFETTLPQQALFQLNSPFILEQADAIAALSVDAASSDAERVDAIFRTVLQRAPTADETAAALSFVRSPKSGDEAPSNTTVWSQLAQTLLLTNEFVFVD